MLVNGISDILCIFMTLLLWKTHSLFGYPLSWSVLVCRTKFFFLVKWMITELGCGFFSLYIFVVVVTGVSLICYKSFCIVVLILFEERQLNAREEEVLNNWWSRRVSGSDVDDCDEYDCRENTSKNENTTNILLTDRQTGRHVWIIV